MLDTLDLTQLRDHGDTLALPDGRMLRLQVVPDDDASFDDFPCYGEVADAEHGAARPAHFDGNSQKLWPPQNGYCHWWQPPRGEYEGPKRGTPEFDQMRAAVGDLLAFGCSGYVVELCEGENAYGSPIVVSHASLWGIEPFPDSEYVAFIVGDLAAEVLA